MHSHRDGSARRARSMARLRRRAGVRTWRGAAAAVVLVLIGVALPAGVAAWRYHDVADALPSFPSTDLAGPAPVGIQVNVVFFVGDRSHVPIRLLGATAAGPPGTQPIGAWLLRDYAHCMSTLVFYGVRADWRGTAGLHNRPCPFRTYPFTDAVIEPGNALSPWYLVIAARFTRRGAFPVFADVEYDAGGSRHRQRIFLGAEIWAGYRTLPGRP